MLDYELIQAQDVSSRRLMVVLHGLGDSIEGYRWLPSAMRFPWMNYLLVNAPDEYYGGYSWFDLYGDAGTGIQRSRKLLFELLDEQRKKGFPSEETSLFGFSQGCLLVLELGIRYPHKLAGIVGISGMLHDVEALIREKSDTVSQQRFLVTHGTYDPLLPIDAVRPQIQALQENQISIDWREFRKEHTIAGEDELKVIREFLLKANNKLSN
jgi:phospholipase/carboxylesterase